MVIKEEIVEADPGLRARVGVFASDRYGICRAGLAGVEFIAPHRNVSKRYNKMQAIPMTLRGAEKLREELDFFEICAPS